VGPAKEQKKPEKKPEAGKKDDKTWANEAVFSGWETGSAS
jgi:hypothetical protein